MPKVKSKSVKEQEKKSVLSLVKDEKEKNLEQPKEKNLVEVKKQMAKEENVIIPGLNIKVKKDEASGKLRLSELEMLRLKNQVLEKKSKIGVTPKSAEEKAKKKRAKAIGRKRKISAALGKLQNALTNMPSYEKLLEEHLKDKLKVQQRYEVKNSTPKSGVNRKRKIGMNKVLTLKEPVYIDSGANI